MPVTPDNSPGGHATEVVGSSGQVYVNINEGGPYFGADTDHLVVRVEDGASGTETEVQPQE